MSKVWKVKKIREVKEGHPNCKSCGITLRKPGNSNKSDRIHSAIKKDVFLECPKCFTMYEIRYEYEEL